MGGRTRGTNENSTVIRATIRANRMTAAVGDQSHCTDASHGCSFPITCKRVSRIMASTKPTKRAEKIDELLAKDDFADLWTTLWAEQLRVMGGNYAPDGTYAVAEPETGIPSEVTPSRVAIEVLV